MLRCKEAKFKGYKAEVSKVASIILEWWEQVQFQTTGPYGEYNVYDEPPEFVVWAQDINKKG